MARKYMKIRRVVIPFLTLAIMLSQLSGCAVVSPEDIVDNPDDVTLVIEEPDLDTETDKNTVDIDGKQYDISGTTNNDVPQKKEVILTTEELHALFKKEYEYNEWGKVNLGEYYESMCLKLPAREIGTQADANAYSRVEDDVKTPEYEGKILPDDGFEQYVAWREALEKGSSSGNNQSGNNSGNTSNTVNTGNTGGQTQQKPSTKPSGGSNNSSGGSSNNGGSSGNSGNSSGGNGGSVNVYDDAHITNTVPDNGDFGESSIEKDYEKPSYDIVG